MNLDQITADARAFAELQRRATEGPYRLRPGKYDLWGMVRRPDGMPIADFGTFALIEEWTPKPDPDTAAWKIGPPQVESNAELFIASRNTDLPAHVEALVARVRELEAALEVSRESRDEACNEAAASVKCEMAALRSMVQQLTAALSALAHAADGFAAEQPEDDGARFNGKVQPISVKEGNELNAALKTAWEVLGE